jgi:hypothetical protein
MPTETSRCERSGRTIRWAQGILVADLVSGDWSFVSPQAVDDLQDYQLPLAGLLQSPGAMAAQVAQLRAKTWFRPEKFTQLLDRLFCVA